MTSVQQYSLSKLEEIGKWRGKYLEEPNADLMMGMVSVPLQESNETVENKRYYVSDTELIERRFLKDATEEFDKDKDVDPFGESDLHDNLYDCGLRSLNIEDKVKKLGQDKFMSGNAYENITFREIVQFVKTDKYKIPEKVDQKLDDMNKVKILGEAMNIPMIIEDTDTFTNNYVKWNRDFEIIYIRRVVDGWLSIKSGYDDLLKKNVIKEPMEKPRKEGDIYKITTRKKVKDILERLSFLKIQIDGDKKKNNLINTYFKYIAFPERFLSTIDA